jgi:formate dehydrogenase subunit beta
MSRDIENGIQVRAREMLSLGEIGCVIGYERGPRQRIRPVFVYDEADVERLAWDQSCHHNLTVYLRDHVTTSRRRGTAPRAAGRVAVVAKPCDVRALNVLIHEDQVARDEVFVIGVACPGMLASDGVHAGLLAENCHRCTERVPIFYDALVGEPPDVDSPEVHWADLSEVEGMTPAERLAFWSREFERCIRCYACRQACPGCYCFECLAEQVDPEWMSIAHRVPEKAFFHIMRAYHLAGRCVDCQACDRACPVHIPLSLLNRRIAEEIELLFNYHAGGDPAIPPPLATFQKDEELPL